MPPFTIISETETSATGPGWEFLIAVGEQQIVLTLSWADYNLWSPSGGDPPAEVALAVVRFLMDRDGAGSLKPSFDCSLARRLHPDADAEIPGMIRG